MFASGGIRDRADPVVLRLVWGLDRDRRYLITESVIEGSEYPSLSDIAPAAFAEECEMYEQFGIRPAGGKPLNRVALPPRAGPDFPRLGHPPPERARPTCTRRTSSAGRRSSSRSDRSARSAVESLYYGLVTSGEEVVDLYLFTWHKHRGVEWRLRGRTPREALFHVERTEGLGAVGNGWAFAAAAEAALEHGAAVEGDARPGRSRWSWSGCTTTRPRSRRCASPPAWPSARRPPRSRWSGCSG